MVIPDDAPQWRPCTPLDAPALGRFNAQLAEDEGAPSLGPTSFYVERMRTWLSQGRYQAALAWAQDEPVAYALWRDDPDYADIFVRQFFVAREHRGRGMGQRLFEQAVRQFWDGRPLRLDVYDSNPRGAAFWARLGFAPYSRLMRRMPAEPGVNANPACPLRTRTDRA
jgi:GNAT superfamily N-acetyltransferase